MSRSSHTARLISIASAAFSLSFSSAVLAVDADAALTLARQNGCLKCHAVDKHKDGPAYRDVAAKYKDKDHAETVKRLITHITSGEKAKFPDGHEEEHKIIKVKDVAQQTNLIEWILSLPGGKWPEN
ncbi:MAG TPA: c-type cytochrome [Novimethylophilus sp.]|jgi:cytochrome c|uniref:c-type cytochrome n=1 Tax=Novimethylophilus sp. TaxID=2137426 RepID=UPI002F3FE31F